MFVGIVLGLIVGFFIGSGWPFIRIDSSIIGEVNPPSTGVNPPSTGGSGPTNSPASLLSTLKSSFLNQLIAQVFDWVTHLLIAIGSILLHLFDSEEPTNDSFGGDEGGNEAPAGNNQAELAIGNNPAEQLAGNNPAGAPLYYGQCSEIRGTNHAFMPEIDSSVEAVSLTDYVSWEAVFQHFLCFPIVPNGVSLKDYVPYIGAALYMVPGGDAGFNPGPSNPASSSSAGGMQPITWLDPRVSAWVDTQPGKSLASPTPSWAQNHIANRGGYHQVFAQTDWRVIGQPLGDSGRKIPPERIFVIFRNGVHAPADYFIRTCDVATLEAGREHLSWPHKLEVPTQWERLYCQNRGFDYWKK